MRRIISKPKDLTRRTFMVGCALSPSLAAASNQAQSDQTTAASPSQGAKVKVVETDTASNVAIVDTASDTTAFVPKLAEKGVMAVGRYYAREFNADIPSKQLKPPEANALLKAGLSILSIYEYKSNHADKFVKGLPDTGSTESEAKADALAAMEQAKAVGQTDNSAIYFTVDFDLEPGNETASKAVIAYFQAVRECLAGQYRLGAYGNGYTNQILSEAGLIDYSWLSASIHFSDTANFYRKSNWHLFQNVTDLLWFSSDGCSGGLPIDSDIQNPEQPDFGAWGNAPIPIERTQKIFASRRFALKNCDVRALPKATASHPKHLMCVTHDKGWRAVPYSIVYRGWNIRVIGEVDNWLLADLNEDGIIDGYLHNGHFSEHFLDMPLLTEPAEKN